MAIMLYSNKKARCFSTAGMGCYRPWQEDPTEFEDLRYCTH
jgi:hypothetical protein